MTNILLMLMLPVIRAQRVSSSAPSCPASCVVCSEDAVICNRLAHIIDAPDTAQALLLTEGSISTIQPASLSDLSNITVIGLSHNHISVLGEHSFRGLPFLHTLLLDHNLLTSQALHRGALTNLTQLEVLSLGHNRISMIKGGWFEGSKALRSLKLEGNQLTSLDSGSFPLKDLKYLESLDLSDNLINHVDKDSFSGLVSLKTLDLSRNRLSSAPVEAFSYLGWLTDLSLDRNSWNCSCQLLELTAFLSNFIQQPDKTLYNGRRMVCVSADNPAVTTVLELTEANCVPSNQNITVQIETRGSVTPQLYARDLAITAVICFIGGVGLTLLAVLIYYRVSLRKKLRESNRQKVEEEESSAMANHHVSQQDGSGKKWDRFLQANSSQSWDREVTTLKAGADGYGRQVRSRVDENSSDFCCPDCSTDSQRGMQPNLMRWNNRMNAGVEAEEELEKRKVRMMTEEDGRTLGTRQGILTRDFPAKLLSRGNTNPSSHQWKETDSQRPETIAAYREMGDCYRTDMDSKGKGHLHCKSCHRTYRPQGRIHNVRESALFNGFPSQHRQIDMAMNVNHSQFDMMKNMRRETRSVTFDLEEGNSPGKERGIKLTHKSPKAQSSRLVKVKLNLNPLRRSKVHPKRKTEQGHSDKSSPKKSKDRRRDGKGRGERDGRAKSDKKTEGRREKVRKSKGSTEDVEEDREEPVKKSEGPSPRKQGGQESIEDDQGEHQHPENSEPGDTTNTADQAASAVAIGQGQTKDTQGQSIQFQGAGLVLGSSQLSSQHHLPPSATDRSGSISLSGLSGAQLAGQRLSLQGGNLLLNTMAPGSGALFPSNLANSTAPNIATIMAPSGAPSFSRLAGLSLMTPVSSVLANPLQASSIHTSPLHPSQPAGLASSLPANPAINPVPGQSLSQSQLPSDSSPLTARLQSDPAQGPGSQASKGEYQLPPQAPETKEGLTALTQAPASVDVFSVASPQDQGSGTIADNLSNNNSQTGPGCAPDGSTVNMTAGVVAPTEGLTAGVSGDRMHAAGVSVSGVPASSMSPQGDAASVLLQQEYLSEEGGASPRRKLRLVLPEKTSGRPPTALERKIR